MKIEKTYKLTIKDTSFDLTEEEVRSLYEACRTSLNISSIGPITIPRTNPPFDPISPSYPSWPTYPGVTWGPSTSICENPLKTAIPSRDIKFVETAEGVKVPSEGC